MRYLNIDELVAEMVDLMKNNFFGSTRQRFLQAKKEVLERIEGIIEENGKEILGDYSK